METDDVAMKHRYSCKDSNSRGGDCMMYTDESIRVRGTRKSRPSVRLVRGKKSVGVKTLDRGHLGLLSVHVHGHGS